MLFNLRGGALVRILNLGSSCFIIPSSVNSQVRHAARKGYRDKVQKKKKTSKAAAKEASKKEHILKKKFIKIERTVERDKPNPPNDDVFIESHFKYVKYSLKEAIEFYKEFHHPTMFNNPEASIQVKIELNMYGKKKTQTMNTFDGVAAIPYPLSKSAKREVMVFCMPENAEKAVKLGASIAGGADLVKKIQGGVIFPSVYDVIISESSFLSQLSPIRGLLKQQYPKNKNGTITNDLETAIPRFIYGIPYKCAKIEENVSFGVVNCDIGNIEMDADQVEENFKALLKALEEHRLNKEEDFFTWIWCSSPPSRKQFAIDLSRYVEQQQIQDDDDDDDDEDKVKSNRSVAAKQG